MAGVKPGPGEPVAGDPDPSDSRAGYRVLRPRQLRNVNEIAVLRHLIAAGPASRLEIAQELGLTQGPITRIVGRLMERGLVRESPQRAPAVGRGRPKVPIEVIAEARMIIGAHIGLQHLTIGAAGIDGKPVNGVQVDHDGTWPGTLEQIADFVARTEQQFSAPLIGVGVIIGGVVDGNRGALTVHDTLGWQHVGMRDDLAQRLDRPVFVEASARAHAQADVLFGTAGKVQNFLHVFVGNIVEVATVVDGQVRAGRDGVAGDVSSWILGDDHGRAITAGAALGDQHVLEQARQRGVIETGDGLDQLVARAGQPDGGGAARELLLQRAAQVGRLLAQLDALLAPEMIVISSGVVAVSGALAAASAAMQSSRQTVRVPPLRMTRYGSNPLVSAAAAVVLDRTLLDTAG
ncbi:MAG TPA: ROK family protein [Microlunatus sp.]